LMQWVSSSHITKKQEMLKKQTPSIRYKDIIMICCKEDNQHDIVY